MLDKVLPLEYNELNKTKEEKHNTNLGNLFLADEADESESISILRKWRTVQWHRKNHSKTISYKSLHRKTE